MKGDSGSGRQNRIRFVMLEADLGEGNFAELTQAITNALKPTVVALPRISAPAPPAPALRSGNGNGSGDVALGDAPPEETLDANEEEPEAAPAPARAKGSPRKLPIPDYLSDMFADDQVRASFTQFVSEHPTKKTSERYLLASYWLKESGHTSVNVHKMYTCYRTANWSTNISDWDAQFRSHVAQDKLRRSAPGEYVITPLGEDAVRKLKLN